MYNIVQRQGVFEIDRAADDEAYEEILNNPLCTITENKIMTTKESEYNDDGIKVREWETIKRIVTYQTKQLIE